LIGAALIFGSKVGMSIASNEVAATGQRVQINDIVYISFIGAALWVWGCVHLAIVYRLNPAFGLLGLFFLVGFFILLWCGKKKPDWDIAAARRRAMNPGNKNRGDPTSLY
jgi:hypothetical protein